VAPVTIENPILNSPFQAPGRHFRFDNEGITTDIDEKRRPSAFFMPIARARKKGEQAHFDTEWTADRIKPNSEINRIRERVDRWRQGGYVDVTPAAEEARAVVEPVLRAWEVDADLRWNRGELRFEFDGAEARSAVRIGRITGRGSLFQFDASRPLRARASPFPLRCPRDPSLDPTSQPPCGPQHPALQYGGMVSVW
jgi:hypothetical protein